MKIFIHKRSFSLNKKKRLKNNLHPISKADDVNACFLQFFENEKNEERKYEEIKKCCMHSYAAT